MAESRLVVAQGWEALGGGVGYERCLPKRIGSLLGATEMF